MQRFGLLYIYSLIVADDYILWIASLHSQRRIKRKRTTFLDCFVCCKDD